MITENVSTLKIHKLTQEQYNRELAAGRINETELYLTPDEEIDLSGYATVEQMNKKANISDTVDLTSEQTINGVKSFENGIQIGDAKFEYDSTKQRLVISFE